LKLTPSNLGQIIGRLQCEEELVEPEPSAPLPSEPVEQPPEPKKRKGRMIGTGPVQRAVLQLLATRTNLSANEVGQALGISIAHSTVMLCKLNDAKLVKRIGERHGFRYSLP
jgi:hypothetical protein